MVHPTTTTVLKVVYTKPMLGIVEQDPMLVGSVEDWTTFKRIARLPSTLKVVTEMMQFSLMPILLLAKRAMP